MLNTCLQTQVIPAHTYVAMFFCINKNRWSYVAPSTLNKLQYILCQCRSFAFLFELKNERNTPHQHATIEKKKKINSYNIFNLQKFGSIPIDCCCVRELSLTRKTCVALITDRHFTWLVYAKRSQCYRQI